MYSSSWHVSLLLSLAALAPASDHPARAGEARPVPIKVYCAAKTVDAARAIDDLRSSIRKKNAWMQLVENPQDAGVIVQVTNRETWVLYDGDGEAESREYRLTARLFARDFVGEIIGRCSDWLPHTPESWRCATGKVAAQVEKFVKQNYRAITRR